MTFQQMRYVHAIAKCGSFNEAAKILYVSQPSLSNAVKELEHELGIRIFVRSSKGIELSAEGQEFLSYARQMTELMDVVQERYSGAYSAPPLYFSVSSQHYMFVEQAFIEILNELQVPSYRVSIRETSALQVMEDVRSGASEIGILYISPANERFIRKRLQDSRLEFHSLAVVPPCAFLRAGHPLAGRREIDVRELEPYPFVLYEQGGGMNYGEEIIPPFQIRRMIRALDRGSLLNIIKKTDAYNIGSGILSREQRQEMACVPVKMPEETSMDIGWIQGKNAALSPVSRQMVEIVRRYVSEGGAQNSSF